MAGVKVTDLTTLGTAATDDVMYIVDTSANQSKQIEVQNLYDGMPQFESGNYTPTVSGEINCVGTQADGIYSRVGNVVTVSYRIETLIDAGLDNCQFNINPPIGTDFTNAKGFFASVTNSVDNTIYGYVQSDSTYDQLSVSIYNVPTGVDPYSIAYLYIVGQYVIV